MEERNGKVWHKFPEEKPTEGGLYVAIVPYSVIDGYYISTMIYYVESGLFNWNGKGENTSLEVFYWAETESILPEELKVEG